MMRTRVNQISLQGRPTQGVNVMDVGNDDRVAAVAVIDMRKEYAMGELPTGASADNGDGATPTNGKKAPKRGKSGGNGRKAK